MGFTVVQLLPINDTGDEMFPFSPLSCFSLHPLLLSVGALPNLSRLPADALKLLDILRAKNAAVRVDWKEGRQVHSFCSDP